MRCDCVVSDSSHIWGEHLKDKGFIWDFPKIRARIRILQGHPQKEPPSYMNSHTVLMIIPALNLPDINPQSPLKEP